MEGRGGGEPLLTVPGSIGGDHTFAEQQLGTLLSALLHKVCVLDDEDFAEIVGVI
jgi:hypothetical protein